MKKIIILLLMAGISLALSGCKAKKTSSSVLMTTLRKIITTTTLTEEETTTTKKKETEDTTTLPVTESVTTTTIEEITTTLEIVTTSLSSTEELIGYYSNLNLDSLLTQSKADIRQGIYNLISKCSITISYTDTRDYFYLTDKNPETGKIQLFYSHLETEADATTHRLTLGSSSGQFNREHVWPQSLGQSKNQQGGYDLHHIRPTLCDLNSARGDKILGNVDHTSSNAVTYKGVTYAYSTSSTFEPMDDVKGDVARICFYYSIMYGYDLSVIVSDDTYKEILEWNKLDPVSEVEINRNEVVYGLQGNRNIFIDFPDLADYIWA